MQRMAAQASFKYNQALDFPESKKHNHIFLKPHIAEKSTSNPDHLVHSSRPENHGFVNNLTDNVFNPRDELGHLSCSSAQDDPASFDGFGFHSIGDGTSLDPWCEALGPNFDLLPKFQTESQSLDLILDPRAAEWSMPWEEGLPDTASSNALPVSPGNSYQPTPNLTECSTPTPFFISNSPQNATSRRINGFDTKDQRRQATLSRSRAADRFFLYGVLTTKVFCRPSCASRRP